MPPTALPPAALLSPDWAVSPRVRALFTTRDGGQSLAPYNSLNLGDHVGDDPSAVARNRSALQAHLGRAPNYLAQVHGTEVLDLTAPLDSAATADGSASSVPGVVCTVMVADCLPVLLAERQGHWVSALHAGWRGLLGSGGVGVLEAGVRRYRMQNANPSLVEYTDNASDLVAWLGPCIGPTAFEVGNEVREAFVHDDAHAAGCFAPLPGHKWLADLPALARLRLRACGVTEVYGNDGSLPWCTVRNPGRFFSHRRDRISGRMAACIWIEPVL